MQRPQGTNAYFASSDAYDNFMGRYARPLAKQFVKSIPLAKGDKVLDLGCGPGALTGELVAMLGTEAVSVVDPSPPFLNECAARHPGITAKLGRAEEIPYSDQTFDAVISQLVIHFVGDLPQAGREIHRVTRPGGWVAACTWIIDRMELLSLLPQAAGAVGAPVPPEQRVQDFSKEGDIASWFDSLGFVEVAETTTVVTSSYADFDELWNAYMGGTGPLGAWAIPQPFDTKLAIRAELFRMLDEPGGEFELTAVARSAVGRTPV